MSYIVMGPLTVARLMRPSRPGEAKPTTMYFTTETGLVETTCRTAYREQVRIGARAGRASVGSQWVVRKTYSS